MLQACLNGGRTRDFHPAVPLSADELAADAKAVIAAGAQQIHLHVRGADGKESLHPDDVAHTLAAVRAGRARRAARAFHRLVDSAEGPRAAGAHPGMAGPARLCLDQPDRGGFRRGDRPRVVERHWRRGRHLVGGRRREIRRPSHGPPLPARADRDQRAGSCRRPWARIATSSAILDRAGICLPRLLHGPMPRCGRSSARRWRKTSTDGSGSRTASTCPPEQSPTAMQH